MTKTKDTRPTFIYVLKDPRTGEVRYVGKTKNSLRKRLTDHIYDSKRHKNRRANWIKSLAKKGLEPIIELIETVSSGEDWAEREKYWIKWYRGNGCNLLNMTDGGEGSAGYVYTEEVRKRIGDASRGKKRSLDAIEKSARGHMKPVAQYTLSGKFISKWESASVAGQKLDIDSSSIGNCAKLRLSTAGGFQWRYWGETLGADIGSCINKRKRPVARYALNGKFIDKWESGTKAHQVLGVRQEHITHCAKGELKTAGGYQWRYWDETFGHDINPCIDRRKRQ